MNRCFMISCIVLMALALVFLIIGNFDAARDYMIMALIVCSMYFQNKEDEE